MPADQPPRRRTWLRWLNDSEGTSITSQLKELVRFGWVGCLTLGIYAAQLWLLHHYFDLSTWVEATLAYGPCLLVNYLLHRSFTFRSDKRHMAAGPRYLAIQLGGMGINSAVIWLGVDVLGWHFLVAQFLALATLSAWSYLGQKLWAFL